MTSGRLSRKRIGQVLWLLVLGLMLAVGGTEDGGAGQASPPEIVKVEFPQVIPLAGGKGRLHFRDPDGDVVLVKLLPAESVSGLPSSWFDPKVQGETEGSFEFKINGWPLPSLGAAKVFLQDATGAWSQPAFFTFAWGDPSEVRKQYDQEQATVRETRVRVPLNFFIFEDGITELGANGKFKDEQAPLGDPDPLVRQLIEQVIVPDLNGIYDQCGVALELGIVKVLRPDKVRLPSGITLGSLFIETPIGRAMGFPTDEHRQMVAAAIPILNQLLKAEGLEISKDARNQFVFGWRYGNSSQGGWAYPNNPFAPGRISAVAWAAYWFDASAQQFYKPRQVVRLIAHELGHNFGLDHSEPIYQGINLMSYASPLVVELTPEQCEIMHKSIELPDFPRG